MYMIVFAAESRKKTKRTRNRQGKFNICFFWKNETMASRITADKNSHKLDAIRWVFSVRFWGFYCRPAEPPTSKPEMTTTTRMKHVGIHPIRSAEINNESRLMYTFWPPGRGRAVIQVGLEIQKVNKIDSRLSEMVGSRVCSYRGIHCSRSVIDVRAVIRSMQLPISRVVSENTSQQKSAFDDAEGERCLREKEGCEFDVWTSGRPIWDWFHLQLVEIDTYLVHGYT